MRAHGRSLTALAVIAGVKRARFEPDWLLRRRVRRALRRAERSSAALAPGMLVGIAAETIGTGDRVVIDSSSGHVRRERQGDKRI
jgi:hypothetical protein